MALDAGRAERIHDLKHTRPDLTWAQIADKVGVTERSAIEWQKTGGISHPNCVKLAAVFDVDPDWLWSGVERGETPDLLATLNGNPAQLDRIEAMLGQILSRLEALELGAILETEADQLDGHQQQPGSAQVRKTRSRRAS